MDERHTNDEIAPANDPAEDEGRLTDDQPALAGAVNSAQLGVTPGTGLAGAVEEDDEVLENGRRGGRGVTD